VQANRFPELVLAGSVVIQATKFELPLAAPCSCIFSVRPDLSDLLPTLACLRAHENLTLARVKHGTMPFLTVCSSLTVRADCLFHSDYPP